VLPGLTLSLLNCFVRGLGLAFLSLGRHRASKQGENVDFVTKFEKALRKKHHSLMTELAKIEHLIDAFEKGAKRGAKRMGRGRISAAGRKRISIAQKRRWAAKKK
ncbi:MAG: hypothetical protein WA641_13025, partial [Candidatus Acidiferrales bacterium]